MLPVILVHNAYLSAEIQVICPYDSIDNVVYAYWYVITYSSHILI